MLRRVKKNVQNELGDKVPQLCMHANSCLTDWSHYERLKLIFLVIFLRDSERCIVVCVRTCL